MFRLNETLQFNCCSTRAWKGEYLRCQAELWNEVGH